LIPNIISPNGDGKNDYWRLDFINAFFPDAEIEIFNRWGESIFKSKGYSNAWDGSYRGNPLPVGVYFFTIDLKDPKFPDIIKGTITLVK
jgi:gliding motility-associated-like protein